jgi:hypothetical protein
VVRVTRRPRSRIDLHDSRHEKHVCLGPLFRIVLPRQARERIFERGDRQFPVLRPVASNALRVNKAQVHLRRLVNSFTSRETVASVPLSPEELLLI